MEEKMESARKFLKGKQVLVTGGCGFIGANLTNRLVEMGAKVRVFDNKTTKANKQYQPNSDWYCHRH